MTQVVFKSEKKTRKKLMGAYEFYKKKYPNASEKELLLDVMRASFLILDKPPDQYKPKKLITTQDVDEIVKEANSINELINILINRNLSPDMAPWL